MRVRLKLSQLVQDRSGSFCCSSSLLPAPPDADALAAIVDVLRRAGAKVTVASVESDLEVVMSRQVKLVADKRIQDVAADEFDLIALPVRRPFVGQRGGDPLLGKRIQRPGSRPGALDY